MRLSPAELEQITGKEKPFAQARWFKLHYGVTLSHDSRGVIITKTAFEGLVAKQCGLAEKTNEVRPAVRLLRTKKQSSE